MHSFSLTAVGNLARDPERLVKGDGACTRLRLVGNDYAGKDAQGKRLEMVTSLSFVAFGPLGELLATKVRRGDQLMLWAHVRSNDWTGKDGAIQHDHDFVIQGFRFGAPGKVTREVWAERDAMASEASQSPF